MKLKKITSGLALLMLLAGTATVASCKGDDEPTPTPDTGDTDNNNDSTGGNTGGTTGGETGGNTGGTTGGETGGNTGGTTGGTTEEDPYKDFIKIEDAEDFVDFLQGELEEVSEGAGLVGNYTLAADIDLTGVDFSTELTSVYSFQGVFDGAGHKISNLTLACQKNKGLFEGMYASAFKNVVFENVTLTSAVNDKGVSLLGNYIAGNSVLENITIKGFNMTCVSAENGGLITNAADTVYLKNIAITGINATLANHSGVVLGSMRRGADDIKVVGTSTEHEGAIINAENILLEGSITSVAANNEGIGGLIGRCDAVEEGMALNVDGFASQLVIKSGKNSGALLGNEKNTLEVSLKNCYFLGGKNLLAGTLQSTANMFFGQIKTPNLTYEDCYYVARNAVVAKTTSDYSSYTNFGYFNDENIVPIKASEIEAFKGFTVADGKVTLNGQSITLPADVTVADVAAPSVTFNTSNVQGVDATTVKITGEIPYFHAASEAGAAGNYVPITFTAATGVDGTDSYYVSGTSVTYVNDETFTVYVPVNELEAGVEAREALTLTVRWNNAAADQTYTVQFDDANITLADAPAYGAVSQDNADLTAANPTTGEGTDAVTDNYTLHYTAGTIAYDETNKGNFVTVKVAQPTWITTATTETIKVTNATVVSLESGVLTLSVKVAKAGTAFKVQWSDITDPNEYKLTFADEVEFAKSTSGVQQVTETYTFSGLNLDASLFDSSSKLINHYTVAATDTMPKHILVSGMKIEPTKTFTDGSDTLTGAINVQGANKGAIIKVPHDGKITVKFAGNGNADRGLVLHKMNVDLDSIDTTLAMGSSVYESSTEGTLKTTAGSEVLTETFNSVSAGTYCVAATNGLRIISITVDMEVASAAEEHTLSMSFADMYTEVVALANLQNSDGVVITSPVDKMKIGQDTDYTFTSASLNWLTIAGKPSKGYFRTQGDPISGIKRMGIASKMQNYLSFKVYGKGTITATFVSTGNTNTCPFFVMAGDNYLAANETAEAAVWTGKDTTTVTLDATKLYSYSEAASTGKTIAANTYAVVNSGTITVTFNFDATAAADGLEIKIGTPDSIQGRGVDISALSVVDTY